MSRSYEPVWTFRTKRFSVCLSITPDEDLDLSWDDDGSIREGLESGKYEAFIAKIEVIFRETSAVIGKDYLCGCIYENVRAFIRPERCGCFRDMVSTAIAEARKTANVRIPLHA